MSRLAVLLATRRGLVVLLLAAGGLLVLAAGREWVSGTVQGVAATRVAVAGREAAPGAIAAGLVVLAAALAMTTAGRLVLRLAAVVVLVGGAAVAVASVLAVRDPAAALGSAAATASGVRGAEVTGVSVTAWPWVAAAAGLVAVGGGLLALVRAGRWTAPRRFESRPGSPDPGAPGSPAATAGTPPPATDRDAAMDAWDALSRGDDPT